jgi:hypothetical protein
MPTYYILLHVVIFLSGVIVTILASWIEQTSNIPAAISQALGVSVSAAGIVGWFMALYIRRFENVSNLQNIFGRAGLSNVFEARQVRIKEEYDKRLRTFNQHVDVMGYGLSNFLQDYRDHFLTWAERGQVRILIVDPDFPNSELCFADLRDTEEEDQQGTIVRQVETFLEFYKRNDTLYHSEKFSVRLYKAIPSISFMRIDDALFWGPYLVKKASRNTPTLMTQRGGYLFDAISAHFEAIWADGNLSRPVRR